MDDLRKVVPVCPTCAGSTRLCKAERDGRVYEGVWCPKCKHFWTTKEHADEGRH